MDSKTGSARMAKTAAGKKKDKRAKNAFTETCTQMEGPVAAPAQLWDAKQGKNRRAPEDTIEGKAREMAKQRIKDNFEMLPELEIYMVRVDGDTLWDGIFIDKVRMATKAPDTRKFRKG